MSLRDYQRMFMSAVRYDHTPEQLSGVIRGGGTLSADKAIDVYRRMYWYRLVDAHFDLLPRTARLLGAKRFTREVCACLAAQPSRTTVIERLALPFAHFLATRELSREARELALLEALAIESLLSEDPPSPLFTREDAASPRLADTPLATVPSFRAAIVSKETFRWFALIPKEGDISEHPLTLAVDPANAAEEIGVVFCRPAHSVLHHSVPRCDAEMFRMLDLANGILAGEVLVALAGSDDNARRAFERFAFFLDHQCFMHSPNGARS